MSTSNCPYCNEKVPYLEKLKPLYKGPDFIFCKCCNKKVSPYWLKNRGGVWPAVAAIVGGRIAAGSGNEVAYIAAALLCFIMAYMVVAARIPLSQCDEMTREALQAEFISKATGVNFTRIAIIVASVIVAFTAFIWVLSNGKT